MHNRRTFLKSTVGISVGAAWAAIVPARGAAPVRKVRVGLLGTWHSHAAGKLEAVRKQGDLFEIVGVAQAGAKTPAPLPALESYAGLTSLSESQLLEAPGLDAVIIECERREFVPAALRCAAAGKHIHLEKPAGPTFAPFRDLARICRERKLVLQMGYMFRYNPGLQFCFRAVREGWLGEIYEVHGVIGKVFGAQARKEDAEFPGGAMYELGCHLIDAVVALLGRPNKVHSFLQHTADDGLADNTLAVLEFEKSTATIRCSAVDFDGFGRRQLAVYGTRGSVVLLPLEPPQVVLNLARPQGAYAKGRQEVTLPPARGRYDEQMNIFGRTVLGEREPDFTLEHDLTVQETVLRACGMTVDA